MRIEELHASLVSGWKMCYIPYLCVDSSSLVESFVWLTPFLCVQRKRREKKKREDNKKKKKTQIPPISGLTYRQNRFFDAFPSRTRHFFRTARLTFGDLNEK